MSNMSNSPNNPSTENNKGKNDKVVTVRLDPKHYQMLRNVANNKYRSSFSLSHTVRLLIEDAVKEMEKEGRGDAA